MEQSNLPKALLRQIVPTPVQVLLALSISAAIILITQMGSVAKYLGITNEGVESFADGLHTQTSGILASSFASNLVLVVFWGAVGLIAYLVTWAVVNFYIETRNTVTIDTKYANRGHWRGPWETLAIKSVSAAILLALLASFKYGLSLWLGLAQPAFTAPSLINILIAAGAWLGLAVELYAIYLLFVLTVTPWYRTIAFTE